MIKADNLYKAYGRNRVLQGLSFTVEKGQSLVIMGSSGTGKSVLLKCLLGLECPDRGTIKVAGLVNPRPQVLATQVGMLFQGAALFDSLPVWHNVAFRLMRGPGRLRHDAARALAVEKLERVGLEEATADLFPAELSGGMQKRVGLARAIAGDPPVLFFDEPTAGLDPIMAGVINALIREIVTELGATALTITHDMRTLADVADCVALLHEGRFHWQGSVSDAFATDDSLMRQFTQTQIPPPGKKS